MDYVIGFFAFREWNIYFCVRQHTSLLNSEAIKTG